MKSENQTMITNLGAELPGENEIAKLAKLEAEWLRLEKEERERNPLRIPADYEAAYEVFVDNPTAENEAVVSELADQNATATLFAATRASLADRRRFATGKAGYILKPFCAQIMAALYGYLAVQMKDLGVPRNDPSLLECREVLDVMIRMEVHLRWATAFKSELTPMELAAPILSL